MMWRRILGLLAVVALVVGVVLLFPRERADWEGPVRAVEAREAGGVQADIPPEVVLFLENGQSWRAARAMREHLARVGEADPRAVLVAARAEAGWGGWSRVRDYLEGRPWLNELEGGEGWYWLARALDEQGDVEAARRAYESYLFASGDQGDPELGIVAELRRGILLLRSGSTEEGAATLARIGEQAPEIGERIDLLAAEALAEAGDTAAVRSRIPEGPADLAHRARLALVAAYEAAGDPRGSRALALAFRDRAGAAGREAAFSHAAGRLALQLGDTSAARADLLRAIESSAASGSALEAARLLAGVPRLDLSERLAVAEVLDRHGADREAAGHYAVWLESGVGGTDERQSVRLRMGRALFATGDYSGAVRALAPLLDAPGDVGANAMLTVGRAEYRRGNARRAEQVFADLARRHPGSAAGSEGLFLVADLKHDDGDMATALRLYRRVASEFAARDRAGLSLMRLGGAAYEAGDYGGAAAAWEEYRSRYPRGQRWLQATYWAGRALEAVGDREGAADRYSAIREREPLSYYAVRAAERLGEQYWPVPMAPAPDPNTQAAARVEEWLRGVDLLRDAGLHAEAEAEADELIQRAGDDPTLLYPLAEALNERGYTARGIRIGYRLWRMADRLNPRILQIIYPFPYRTMIEAEAREKGLDPFLVAALARQESSFKARIASGAGARGLMQIMPETGRKLAAAAGIAEWDAELLYQPEINAHLGTRFLAEQMERYDRSLPSVFAAYNAGPHRVERWKNFPEYRDEELFTERIPYRETRDYVKILTRNIEIYRGLYASPSG